MGSTTVEASRDLLERIRERLISMGQISDFGPELFQLLNCTRPDVSLEVERLKREVAQLRLHKNDYMEAAEETSRALLGQVVGLKSLIVDIGADPAVINLNDALTDRMSAVLCGPPK